MFNRGKIESLEKKVEEQAKKIEALEGLIAKVESCITVKTGHLEPKLMWAAFGSLWKDVEKTAPVNKVLRAIVDQLGLQIVVTDEKTETTPERVTVQAIDTGKSEKND